MKRKACAEVGIKSIDIDLPGDASEKMVLETILNLNANPQVHDPNNIIREADIIIAAAGQANMIKTNWIRPGAVVIDVGTNAVDDPSRKSGYRLVGDVAFEEAKSVAGWISLVPGGVGPMTIAILLRNTVDSAKQACVEMWC
ncbi:hypothetical protein SUGI_1178810 [Cryptomeria japonica]|nr:hypothetical protein SUGI_1178810 [Cryptomeria japonica]